MSIALKENRVFPGELCLKCDGYWRTWNRVLHMDLQGSRMVELNLTPIDPLKRDSWVKEVFSMCIRVHTTGHGGTDRIFRHVVKNKQSIVFQEVKRAMLREVPIELAHRLLNEDFLSQIDWEKYVIADRLGGGV